MRMKDGRVAKFMPRYNSPYEITQAHPKSSTYMLLLPPTSKAHPTFHITQLRTHIPNDNELFPGCAHTPPKPLITTDGTTEYFIKKILDRWPHSRGHQFLIRWTGYSPEHDLWLPCSELLELEALAHFKEEEAQLS